MRIIFKAAAIVLVAGAAACGDADRSAEVIQFSVGETEFSVPSKMLRSSRDGRAGFIRISDPETPIEIVYDLRLQHKTDKEGYPLLFSVNDGDYPGLEYSETAVSAPVICRVSAAAATRRCGSPVQFQYSTWAVLFPVARVQEADDFRRDAEILLQNFST